MAGKNDDLAALPPPVRERLDELRAALKAAIGEGLRSMIVHGSAARGGYRKGQSDVDLVVVIAEDAHAELGKISNALNLARFSARIETMILTEAEIPRAADAFPLLYDDIKRCHVVFHGTDPFAPLHIDKRHLRLRIEQELREAQIRLRRAVVDGLGEGDRLAGAVERKARQIRGPLFAWLALRETAAASDHLEEVFAKAGEVLGLDAKPILRARENPNEAHDALRVLIGRAVDDVDRRDDA